MLLDQIKSGNYNGWSVDYVLSEVLGELKADIERRKGLTYLKRDALSRLEISELVTTIEMVKKIPNLKIYKTPSINQIEIYDKVKNLCIQAKDALILISAINLQQGTGNVVLITRDERLLIRGKKEIRTAHPSEYINRCPNNCPTKNICSFYKM